MKIELLWQDSSGRSIRGVRCVSCSKTKEGCLVGHIWEEGTSKKVRYFWDRRVPNRHAVVWVWHLDKPETKTRDRRVISVVERFVSRAVDLGILDMGPGEDEFGQQKLGVLYTFKAKIIRRRGREEESKDVTLTFYAQNAEDAKKTGIAKLGVDYGAKTKGGSRTPLIRQVVITKD